MTFQARVLPMLETTYAIHSTLAPLPKPRMIPFETAEDLERLLLLSQEESCLDLEAKQQILRSLMVRIAHCRVKNSSSSLNLRVRLRRLS
ncbi:MAG: hypothetical protein ACKN9E_07675 [Microcystaceae cyanobacterium]